MRYPGGKGGAGVYQTIINLIPPHETYIETHAGGANIWERKRPAPHSILIDKDPETCERLLASPAMDDGTVGPSTIVINDDCGRWLRARQWKGREFVYCDPPYVMGARRGGKLYRHEYTDQDHRDLLSLLLAVPAAVMISGYRNPIYEEMLTGWQSLDFQGMTRRGPAIETVWMNYEPPAVLHDFGYVGSNYRERERIKRKRLRWRTRLEKLDPMERAALLAELLEILPPEMTMPAGGHRQN